MTTRMALRCVMVAWIPFSLALLFCRPVVVLHYAPNATEPETYFFDERNDITKDHLNPGETLKLYTPMFPTEGSRTYLSLPFSSRDSVTLKLPFSRVDVYISADTKIERTVIRHGFFDRFSAPKNDTVEAG